LRGRGTVVSLAHTLNPAASVSGPPEYSAVGQH
jgi:hypothetical protein